MPTKKELEQQLAALQKENEELKSDPFKGHLIGNHYDDDQLEERAEEIRAKGLEGSGATVGLEPTDKQFLQRGDQFAQGAQPWEVVNPRKELMDKHVPKGFRGRFLSPKHIDQLGPRGWEILEKDGQHIKHANQMLAIMPEEKAKQRKEFFQNKTRRRTREIAARYHEETKSRGLAERRPDKDEGVQIHRRVVEQIPA